METLLTWLFFWWLMHLMFRRWVSSPFPFVARLWKWLWRGITYLIYTCQAQRRGVGFGLLHAFLVFNILITILVLSYRPAQEYYTLLHFWLLFSGCAYLYWRWQRFQHARNRRHRLPGSQRRRLS